MLFKGSMHWHGTMPRGPFFKGKDLFLEINLRNYRKVLTHWKYAMLVKEKENHCKTEINVFNSLKKSG